MVPFDYAQRVAPATALARRRARHPALISQPTRRSTTCWAILPKVVEGATVSGTKSNGTMRYNSLQAVLQKEMSHGLQYQVSYTLLQVHVRQHRLLRRVEQCPECLSLLAERLRSEIGVGAVLLRCHSRPFSLCGLRPSLWPRKGLGQEHATKSFNAVIGGWAVSPIVSFRTGWPYGMRLMERRISPVPFGRGARADCNGIPSITRNPNLHTGNGGFQWFTNTGQFTTASGWHLRQLLTSTRYLRSPHYTDVDLSLHKDFQITERFRLQFRTDFINAFNHVQYNAPIPWDLGPRWDRLPVPSPQGTYSWR